MQQLMRGFPREVNKCELIPNQCQDSTKWHTCDTAWIAMLPAGVVLEILRYCAPEELCRAALVCKLWKSIADQDSLWRCHCHPSWFTDFQSISCKQLYLQWIQREAERYCQKGNVFWISKQDYMQKFSGEKDLSLKLMLIGDSGCGKTEILRRFTDDTFHDEYVTQIGVDFKRKNVVIDGIKIKLQIVCEKISRSYLTLDNRFYSIWKTVLWNISKLDNFFTDICWIYLHCQLIHFSGILQAKNASQRSVLHTSEVLMESSSYSMLEMCAHLTA